MSDTCIDPADDLEAIAGGRSIITRPTCEDLPVLPDREIPLSQLSAELLESVRRVERAAERERVGKLIEEMAIVLEADLVMHECVSGFGTHYPIVTEKDPASVALRELKRRLEGA